MDMETHEARAIVRAFWGELHEIIRPDFEVRSIAHEAHRAGFKAEDRFVEELSSKLPAGWKLIDYPVGSKADVVFKIDVSIGIPHKKEIILLQIKYNEGYHETWPWMPRHVLKAHEVLGYKVRRALLIIDDYNVERLVDELIQWVQKENSDNIRLG